MITVGRNLKAAISFEVELTRDLKLTQSMIFLKKRNSSKQHSEWREAILS
jgi:hypothetical protein